MEFSALRLVCVDFFSLSKNDQDGRLDFTGNLSTGLGWYPLDWLSAEISLLIRCFQPILRVSHCLVILPDINLLI